MKTKEIIKKYRSMKAAELESEIKKQHKDYAVLKLDVAAKKNKNFSAVKKHKKDIARLLTIQAEIKEK